MRKRLSRRQDKKAWRNGIKRQHPRNRVAPFRRGGQRM